MNTMLKRFVAAGLGLAMAFLMTAGSAMAAAKPLPTGKVNINSASAEQLSTLPGVGPKLAARIIEYRQKSGGFKTSQELMNVQGIGEKNFQKIQTYLTAEGGAARPASTK